MTRAIAALVAFSVLASTACGGAEGAPTTSSTPSIEDRRRLIAAEYAESAERAFADTRFEELGPEGIMDLVLDACDRLAAASPDAAVAGAIAALGVDVAGEVVDDLIAVEVVAEGMATVCPNDVLRSSGVDPSVQATDRTTLFLGAVAPFAESSGFAFGDEELVTAGSLVCTELEAGNEPEAAILAGLRSLFDVEAASLAELAEAKEEGVLLGAVLGAAAVYFCPSHAERVAVFVQEGDFG